MTGCPARALLGDNVEILDSMPPRSATALVSDPPAGLRTLVGTTWESDVDAAYCRSVRRTLKAARRVLEPGSYGVLWAYPQTSMWVLLAMRTAKLEVVTRIPWLNAEGKPASAGQLAPGFEEWIIFRVPGPARPLHLERWRAATFGGRHPRNLVLGVGFGRALDDLLGRRKSGARTGKRAPHKDQAVYHAFRGTAPGASAPSDEGGPSRFFMAEEELLAVYGPRARHSHKELYPGGPRTRHPTPKSPHLLVPLVDLVAGCAGEGTPSVHIIDPWFGSGATAEAAVALGHSCTGIERDPALHADGALRVAWLNGEIAA